MMYKVIRILFIILSIPVIVLAFLIGLATIGSKEEQKYYI